MSGCGEGLLSFSEDGEPALRFRRRRRAKTSSARRARTPRPTPRPMPTFAPVPSPPLLESSELLVALLAPVVGVEVMTVLVGVPLISVDDVVVSAAVLAGEEPLLPPLPLWLPPVSMADSVSGRNPPCQSSDAPVALGRLTTFASVAASRNASVREVSGHQQPFVVVTVVGLRLASHNAHSLEVPLQ